MDRGRRYLWVHDPLALASDQDYFTGPFLEHALVEARNSGHMLRPLCALCVPLSPPPTGP